MALFGWRRSILSNQETLSLIVEAMRTPAALVHADMRVISANTMFCAFCGIELGFVSGQSAGKLLAGMHQEKLKSVVHSGEPTGRASVKLDSGADLVIIPAFLSGTDRIFLLMIHEPHEKLNQPKLNEEDSHYAILSSIVESVLKHSEMKEALQDIAVRTLAAIPAATSIISLWDESGQRPVRVGIAGQDKQEHQKVAFETGEPTLGKKALSEGKILVVDSLKDSELVSRRFRDFLDIETAIAVPLAAGSRRLGVIVLLFKERYVPMQAELELLDKIGRYAAYAIDKINLLEEARRTIAISEMLTESAAVLTASLSTEKVVSTVLDELHRVVPYDSAGVELLEGNKLRMIGGRGWADGVDYTGTEFVLDEDSPAWTVVKVKRPHLVPDAQKRYPVLRKFPFIRTWLGIPLIAEDKVIGILVIDSQKDNAFTAEQVDVVTALGSFVSISLQNSILHEQVRDLSRKDYLTDVLNRRGLFEIATKEFERSKRYGTVFSVVMFDVDGFKSINDRLGHEAGDKVLREVAVICQDVIRRADMIGRYGGDEFVILLPETGKKGAKSLTERIRRSIEELIVSFEYGEVNVTCSFGITQREQSDKNVEDTIRKADRALYTAKHTGGNRTELLLKGD